MSYLRSISFTAHELRSVRPTIQIIRWRKGLEWQYPESGILVRGYRLSLAACHELTAGSLGEASAIHSKGEKIHAVSGSGLFAKFR